MTKAPKIRIVITGCGREYKSWTYSPNASQLRKYGTVGALIARCIEKHFGKRASFVQDSGLKRSEYGRIGQIFEPCGISQWRSLTGRVQVRVWTDEGHDEKWAAKRLEAWLKAVEAGKSRTPDHSESETAEQSAVDCFVLVSDAPIPDYERVWNTLQEAVPVAQEIASEFGERVSIHASPDGGEHFDPKPVRTIGEG